MGCFEIDLDVRFAHFVVDECEDFLDDEADVEGFEFYGSCACEVEESADDGVDSVDLVRYDFVECVSEVGVFVSFEE